MAKILLIESNTILTQIYEKALSQAGHEVFSSNNAQHSIMLVDTHKPDLVIVELQLPVHNGLEFLYEFRSYKEWALIPVIIHTIVPPSEFKNNPTLWRHLNIQAYLYKPQTKLVDLLSAVENNLPIKVP